MVIGDLNIFFLFFLLLFFSVLINLNSALNLLMTAEILWITLYAMSFFTGLVYNNLNLLALTFFFLIFSAIELGLGLILLLLQNLIFRSINLNDTDFNFLKLNLKFIVKVFLSKINWKY